MSADPKPNAKKRPHPTAFISVFNKEGIVPFAQALAEMGWPLMSSAGTAAHLSAAGLPVTDIADKVGRPIFGHRVATLSRELYAGLLARDTEDDLAVLDEIGFPRIGLVCVDMYPLADEIARPGCTFASVIEKTDIGGPTLLRAAVKGDSIVVCDALDRPFVVDWLMNGQQDKELVIHRLAAKAEMVVAQYGMASAEYRSAGFYSGNLFQGGRLIIDGAIVLPASVAG